MKRIQKMNRRAPAASLIEMLDAGLGLDPYQAQAWEAIQSGQSLLIEGPGGTGKSHLVRLLRESGDRKTAYTGSTGVSAINMGGTTLHSALKLGLGTEPAPRIAGKLRGTPVEQFIRSIERLVIDEISMIDAPLFELADKVCRIVRAKTDKPFGGLQVCLFGDFLQLPPPSSNPMAFRSKAWEELAPTVVGLRQIHRQDAEEKAFIEALSSFREGRTPADAVALIKGRQGVPFAEGEPDPIELYTRNVDIDAFNAVKLDQIEGQEEEYYAEDSGPERCREMLRKHCLAPETLVLKEGARVMLLRNLDVKLGLANGSLGTVQGMSAGGVHVGFDCGHSCFVGPDIWEVSEAGAVVATREQIPLRLAYAITVHKSQGLTFDSMVVNLANCFAYGQAYTALSRARTLSRLYVRGFDARDVKAHPDALAFLKEASK